MRRAAKVSGSLTTAKAMRCARAASAARSPA